MCLQEVAFGKTCNFRVGPPDQQHWSTLDFCRLPIDGSQRDTNSQKVMPSGNRRKTDVWLSDWMQNHIESWIFSCSTGLKRDMLHAGICSFGFICFRGYGPKLGRVELMDSLCFPLRWCRWSTNPVSRVSMLSPCVKDCPAKRSKNLSEMHFVVFFCKSVLGSKSTSTNTTQFGSISLHKKLHHCLFSSIFWSTFLHENKNKTKRKINQT